MRIRIDGEQMTVVEWRRAGQGIHSDRIYAVEVDPQGRTWASTDHGFDCLDTRLHVGRLEGTISEDCNIQALRQKENASGWVPPPAWSATKPGTENLQPWPRCRTSFM